MALKPSDIKVFFVNSKILPEKGIIENIPLLKNHCEVKL